MQKYYIYLKYMASNKDSLLNYKTELSDAADYFNKNSIAAKNNKAMKIIDIQPDHIKIELISSNSLPVPTKALRLFSVYCTKFLTKTGKQIFTCVETNENFNLLDSKTSNNKDELNNREIACNIIYELKKTLTNKEIANIFECNPAYISKIISDESCNVSNQFLSFIQTKINSNNLNKKDKMINEISTKLYSLDDDQLITFYNFFNSFI